MDPTVTVIHRAFSRTAIHPVDRRRLVETWRKELVAGNLAQKLPEVLLELLPHELVSWTRENLRQPSQAGQSAEEWAREQ